MKGKLNSQLIGMHRVTVVRWLGCAQFGGNPQYLVRVDGQEMETLRQGSIRIWAFRTRYRWSLCAAGEFDTYMDKVHAETVAADEPGDFGHDGVLIPRGAQIHCGETEY